MIGGGKGTAGIGLEFVTGSVVDDGWNMVKISQGWIENCAGWGIKADGTAGRNEGSFTLMEQVFIQGCGTIPANVLVTGITQANPAVVSAAGHTFVNGNVVWMRNMGGMTEVDGLYTVAGMVPGTSFELSRVDSTGFTAFNASNGLTICNAAVLYQAIPTSGGMIWKGQLLTHDHCAFTLCQNVGFFIKGEAGLGIGYVGINTTWENNYQRHILCTGITSFRSIGIQFHGNLNYRQHTGVEFDATNYVVRNVNLEFHVYRASPMQISTHPDGDSYGYITTAFKIGGTFADLNTCRAKGIFDSFDNNPRQVRFSGWHFDDVPEAGELAVLSGTSVVYRPRTVGGMGAGGAGRKAGPTGEWIAVHMPASGCSLSNSNLAISERYYMYLYDDAGAWALEASPTGNTVDTASGYQGQDRGCQPSLCRECEDGWGRSVPHNEHRMAQPHSHSGVADSCRRLDVVFRDLRRPSADHQCPPHLRHGWGACVDMDPSCREGESVAIFYLGLFAVCSLLMTIGANRVRTLSVFVI
jgi:hypothetical protein